MVHYITFPEIFDKILTIPTETIFGIKIYAIMIMSGFLLGALYAMKRAKEFNTDADTVADFLIWALPISIIGARIYYVVYSWDYYSQHPNEIIAIWNGGIAIYGGIIAAVLVIFAFGKIKKMDIWSFFDMGALGLLIGQSIGRWGNFFNAEAFGRATDLPWGMVIRTSIQQTGVAVHPTFLYESLWNALGFVLLHCYSKKRKFKGEIALMYIAWYGLGRGFIEGLRTDSLMLGTTDIRVSQILGFASCIIAVCVLLYMYSSKKGIKINAVETIETITEKPQENIADCEENIKNIEENLKQADEINDLDDSEYNG